jgi:hypothetical protein
MFMDVWPCRTRAVSHVLGREEARRLVRLVTGTDEARTLTPTAALLMMTFRAWLVEVPVAAVNGFVLMDRVYTPHFGALTAHQIGMSTRIALALLLAYFICYFARHYTARTLLLGGVFWMTLWLVFEWGGSLLIGRPVSEILVGWHVEQGYMWPYVLLTYLLAPLLVGSALHPSRPTRGARRRSKTP